MKINNRHITNKSKKLEIPYTWVKLLPYFTEIHIFVSTHTKVSVYPSSERHVVIYSELRCYSDALIHFFTHFIRMGWDVNAIAHHDHVFVN